MMIFLLLQVLRLPAMCHIRTMRHNHLSLKSSEVDVNCGLIPLVYSEHAELQCARLGQVVSCVLQRVRVSITMLIFHQWQDSQINLWNSIKQNSLIDTYSSADWGHFGKQPSYWTCRWGARTSWSSSASSVILPGWQGALQAELGHAQKPVCGEGNLTLLCGNRSWYRRVCYNLTPVAVSVLIISCFWNIIGWHLVHLQKYCMWEAILS